MELMEYLWAKSAPQKQLIAHMIDAGTCAKAYLSAPSSCASRRFLSEQWHCDENTAISFAAYIVALHDIGKASPSFQIQNAAQREKLLSSQFKPLFERQTEQVRHEYHSAFAMRRIWREKNDDDELICSYCRILSLHHQKPQQRERDGRIRHKEWYGLQQQIQEKIAAVFNPPEKLLKPSDMNACCMLLTSLLVLCDWIASSGPFTALGTYDESYAQRSQLKAEEVVRQYGVTGDELFPQITGFESMWPGITSPRAIQAECQRLDPNAALTIIEAPMGEGKTEAALYLAGRQCNAWKKRGIYVALPTQATSNQMYGRVSNMLAYLGKDSPRLLHGMASLAEDRIQSQDHDQAEQWLRPLRMGLLGETAVGTVDQAMAGVLLARFGMLRMLGLSNKVLIIDELHAYDAYMSEIIARLLEWCKAFRIPVILLSATLQSAQKKKYLACFAEKETEMSSDYPLITQVDQAGKVNTVATKAALTSRYRFIPLRLGRSAAMIARFAVERIQHGGCACILVNTVSMAQQVYEELLKLHKPELQTFLFHARYTVERRNEIEQQCLSLFGRNAGESRPNKSVLVATQVVEQSLDLDFDTMISELAPIDLLLQRAGRVHRHRERIRPQGLQEPVIHVVLPDEQADTDLEKRYGLSGKVYAPFLLYNTEQLIHAGKDISVPEDVRDVISQVYDNVSETAEEAWAQMMFDHEAMSANAKGVIWDEPDPETFFPAESHPTFLQIDTDDGYEPALRAATRLGEPTMRIAFCTPEQQEIAKQSTMSKEQARKILLQSVNLSKRNITDDDLQAAALYQVEKGPLRGCYVTCDPNTVAIGNRRLVNDPILGVRWEE